MMGWWRKAEVGGVVWRWVGYTSGGEIGAGGVFILRLHVSLFVTEESVMFG